MVDMDKINWSQLILQFIAITTENNKKTNNLKMWEQNNLYLQISEIPFRFQAHFSFDNGLLRCQSLLILPKGCLGDAVFGPSKKKDKAQNLG